MRTLILVFICALFSGPVFSQRDSIFFFNEFSLSANHTNLANDNTENRTGFGIGAYYSLRPERQFNFIFGFEYNQSRQFKERVYESKFSHASDVTYAVNSFSIPLLCRVNYGKRTRIFIEPGIFLDLNLGVRREGTMHTYSPYGSGISEFSDNVGSTSLNYGPSLGIGIKFPFLRKELIVKTDYKLGLAEVAKYDGSIRNEYFRLMLGLRV